MNPCLDPGELDPGNHDATEVPSHVANVWHPSHVPSVISQQVATASRDIGRHYLQTIRNESKQRPNKTAGTARRVGSTWRDTPEPFRRLVVRAAGLDRAVVDKLDRDLLETEKAAIRLAVRRLKDRADALFAL